jgi:hypothetical protein
MLARLARAVALVIVVAAIVDPAWTTLAPGQGLVSVIGDGEARVADRLRHDYRVVRGYDASADAVVVVDRAYPAEPLPPSAKIATVTLPGTTSPVSIERIDAPVVVPAQTTIRIEASVVAAAAHPPQTLLTATIGGVLAGRAEHTWASGERRWRAALDVVPIGEPPWVIAVACGSAGPCATETIVDRATPLSITFFEPRPSWATTFVRRAVERDRRFHVDAVTRLADADPAVAVVAVGGLDRVSDADTAWLDRFVRERGGALLVLPDARIVPASAFSRRVRLEPDQEVLLDRAVSLTVASPLPRLTASELLTFASVDDEADVLARTGAAQHAVVWSARRGAGRIVVSGAVDAWRFRADAASDFDRFWRAVVSGAALSVPPLVDVKITPPVARPLERLEVHVRLRGSMSGAGVAATLASGEIVRLWPEAESGAFAGTFAAPAHAGVSRISVTAANADARASGAAPFAVSAAPEAPKALEAPEAPLSLLSATRGGIDVSPENLTLLDAWLRATVTPPAVRTTRHPMRSPWWLLLFAGCCAIDWWITSSRRRRR